MGAPDIKADAQRAFEVIKSGGITITPSAMGYALASCTVAGLEKMFKTKRRGPHKRHAMGGNYALHKELHIMKPEDEEIVSCLTQDFDVPLAVIAPYKADHPMLQHIDKTTLEALTVNGTLAMLINAGAFQDELASLTMAAQIPLLGSSANISGSGKSLSKHPFRVSRVCADILLLGTKHVVSDIEPEIMEIADLVIDHGLTKFADRGRSSTMIDFSGPKPEVTRIGVCYELIRDHLKRFWDIDSPPDPGVSSLPSGHLKTLPPLESLERLVAAH